MRYGPMPHFHARLSSFWGLSRTIHRIYITETDFLFIHLDIGTLRPEDAIEQGVATTGGGLIGAVIGHMVAAIGRNRLDRLTRSLEAADEEILREFIEGDDKSFIVPIEEIQDVRIEQKTFWSSLWHRDLLAFLECDCVSRGPLTLGLIAPHEMPMIAEEMQRLFGGVHCDSWRAF